MASFIPQESDRITEFIYKTHIEGLYYLAPNLHPDERGVFAELYHLPDVERLLNTPFLVKQVNLAQSNQNVCRGFHAEGWNKLISIISGTGFCALADIRPNSATYRQVETFILGDGPESLKGSLFITQGIANSVCALKAPLNYLYLVDRLYQDRNQSDEGAISLFDPDLQVDWPIPKDKMILSDRDQTAKLLKDL